MKIASGWRCDFLGPAFGRTDFSRIFIFEPGIFSRIFSPDFFFLLIFVGKKVPRKILQENPRQNPPKFLQQKSSNTFLQIAQGDAILVHSGHGQTPKLRVPPLNLATKKSSERGGNSDSKERALQTVLRREVSSLTAHAPQLRGDGSSPPELRGWTVQNALFYSALSIIP